jgi:hypothetical protein
VTSFTTFAPPDDAGFRVVTGRPDCLQRLLVSGSLRAGQDGLWRAAATSGRANSSKA